MTDLHTALKAAVEERLAMARAATNDTGRWRWDHGLGDMCNDKDCPYGSLLDEAEPGQPTVGTVLMNVHGYDVHQPWEGAAHIAANDPATVIRMCERDLRVLERHVDTGGEPYSDPGNCRGCHASFQEEWAESWPCPEITDLATAYGIGTP